MSDLVLSNLTIQGHPVGIFDSEPVPPIPSIPNVRIGNRLWSTVYVNEEMSGVASITSSTLHGETIYMFRYSDLVNVTFSDGWRIPNMSDYNDLVNTVGASNGNTLISTLDGGSDTYGLNLYKTGLWGVSWQEIANTGCAYFADLNGTRQVNISGGDIDYGNWGEGSAVPFRLVKDAI